jgi:predicted nucleic acid-binding protein
MDLVVPPPEPSNTLTQTLGAMHARHAAAPLRLPERGVFPPALMVGPKSVVGDTRYLVHDIGHACRNRRRTVLITAANQQALRIFCAQHVVDEVEEHHSRWLNPPVPRNVFLERWHDEYLPLIRVVPDDGVPDAWMSPDELARLRILEGIDPDDMPSVKLALALRALYLARDHSALAAVYGEAIPVEHSQWLARLRAGGDAAELLRMLNGTAAAGALVVRGASYGARRAYDALGPVAVGIGAAAALLLWQWLRAEERQSLRSGMWSAVETFAELAALYEAREQYFDAARPSVPSAEALASTNDIASVLGRLALSALAADPHGHMSAEELADRIRRRRPCTDSTLRALLRATPCFDEVYRGRWQVGAVRQGHELPTLSIGTDS